MRIFMIKIAICDDTNEELIKIKNYICDYITFNSKLTFASPDLYSSGIKLCEHIMQNNDYDIYILDILMPDINGIHLGKFLKKYNPQALIIYLTTSKDYLLEAFDLYAFQYQLKPVRKEKLFSILDNAIARLQKDARKSFLLKTSEGHTRIVLSNLIYVEFKNHFAYFHLLEKITFKSLYIRSSFDTFLSPILEDATFIHTHKSFVVNLYYVIKLLPQNLEMQDGSLIPISRSYTKEVKRNYMLYMLNQTNSL